MASTYLSRTTGSPTNSNKCTFSVWFKKSKTGGNNQQLISEYTDSNNRTYIGFNASNQFQFGSYQSSSWVNDFYFSRLFTDVSSFYNFVIAIDTTQSTASDRVKIYINGVLETSVAGSPTYFSQNSSVALNSASKSLQIGAINGSDNFDGSMSHVHFIDGTAYDASAFGETDTTTGEWKAKTSPSVTYGNNGFFILKDGNGITDQSGEGNDFTLGGGTLTDLKDNPDNVFATLNPLAQTLSGISYSSGNTISTMTGDVGQRQSISTLGMDSGKFYMECKCQAIGSTGGSYPYIGIVAQEKYDADMYIGGNGCGWHPTGDIYNGGSTTSTSSTYTTGDIIGVAVDVTNSKLYWHKNGTYITIGGNVQNPSTGSYGFDISARTAEGTLGFGVSSWNNNGIWQVNFGNGFFGTTAITTNSGNGYSGAEGSSKFNYTVPTGYSALSTKGLNE